MRGLSWPPSGPLPPGDVLTPALVVTTAARGRAAPRAGSRRDPSVQRPWRVSAAASDWPSPCHASVQPGAEGGVSWRAVSRNYSTRDTRPAAAGYRPRPYRVWRPDVPPLPHADGWSG